MRKFIFFLILILPFFSFSQDWADDSSLDQIINSKSAFGDDESSIIVVEFWASFNAANAFEDWNKIEEARYYRVDIGKAPKAKKEYRVRMAPTILIFKNGVVEKAFKAGLDLLLPTNLGEIQDAIHEINAASNF